MNNIILPKEIIVHRTNEFYEFSFDVDINDRKLTISKIKKLFNIKKYRERKYKFNHIMYYNQKFKINLNNITNNELIFEKLSDLDFDIINLT